MLKWSDSKDLDMAQEAAIKLQIAQAEPPPPPPSKLAAGKTDNGAKPGT